MFKGKYIRVLNEVKTGFWSEEESPPSDTFPHGTAICGIIAKDASPNVEITSFNIFEVNAGAMMGKLLSALTFACKYEHFDIINISLGVRNPNKDLETVCKSIADQGTIIVSAFDNAGAISFPAAYPFVIGVDTSPRCRRKQDYVFVKNSPINIRAMGSAQRVPWRGSAYTINEGASFAAPHITAVIANYMALNEKYSFSNILKYLEESSQYTYNFSVEDFLPEFPVIHRVALFPYNKEMMSLINFSDKLSFEICGVYDMPRSGHVGLKSESLFNSEQVYEVQSINECDWGSFDTLVIGHLREEELATKESIKAPLLQKCLEYGVNVVSFDEGGLADFYPKFSDRGLTLYAPDTVRIPVGNKFGKLYSIGAPVVGVFGTTRHQGKFTLQLQLRYALLSRGYIVGQLGTEPSSLLFGIDSVYPIGYNGIAVSDMNNCIETANLLMHKMDLKSPEIIIVGSQSGTAPLAYHNIGQMNSHQLSFLLGVQPDAAILCVNYDDGLDVIKRCIDRLQGLGRCKVIGLAVYPFYYGTGWGIISRKKVKASPEECKTKMALLSQEFSLPTTIVGSEKAGDDAYEMCVSYFARRE